MAVHNDADDDAAGFYVVESLKKLDEMRRDYMKKRNNHHCNIFYLGCLCVGGVCEYVPASLDWTSREYLG